MTSSRDVLIGCWGKEISGASRNLSGNFYGRSSLYSRLTRRVLREPYLSRDRHNALATSAASLSNATVTFETSFQSRVFALLLATSCPRPPSLKVFIDLNLRE